MTTTDAELGRMIRELMGSSKIFFVTKQQLASYLDDISQNQLAAADRNWVTALYRRIVVEQGDHEPRRDGTHSDMNPSNQGHAAYGSATLLSAEEWKGRAYKTMERAKRAERRVQELEMRVRQFEEAIRASGGGNDIFQRAKREFARMYHPDNVGGSSIERMVRAEIFKEFWAVLETIEKSSSR